MLSQTTPPDTVERERGLVKRIAGLSDLDQVEFVDSGWTSRVYVINEGQFVFKFPRAEEVKQEYAQEIALLRLLGEVDGYIRVPRVRWTDPNHDYLGYEGIRGAEFAKVSGAVDTETKRRLGRALGGFLARLHRLDLDGGRTVPLGDEIKEFQYKYEISLPVIQRDFTAEEQGRLRALVHDELPSKLWLLGSDPVLCHGDLGYWNMIFKPGGQIGIIDFGDAGYFDRSKDFVGLNDTEVLDEALTVYGDSDALRQKIAARQTILYVLDLPFFIGKNDEAGVARTVAKIKSQIG